MIDVKIADVDLALSYYETMREGEMNNHQRVVRSALRGYLDLRKHALAQQARIDALMFEYCPDEMTCEQRAEWARHQGHVPADEHNTITRAALAKVTP